MSLHKSYPYCPDCVFGTNCYETEYKILRTYCEKRRIEVTGRSIVRCDDFKEKEATKKL